MPTSRRASTLEAFLELPEVKPALEFFEGAPICKPWPDGPHSCLRTEIVTRIDAHAAPRRLALALPELRTTFAGASVVPDVSVYRWDRIPRTSTGRIADDFMLPPDVAVTISAQAQSVSALVRRCLWYVEHGVDVALLVDPEDESVLIIRPNAKPLAARGADPIDIEDVLPGFELTAAALFAALDVR